MGRSRGSRFRLHLAKRITLFLSGVSLIAMTITTTNTYDTNAQTRSTVTATDPTCGSNDNVTQFDWVTHSAGHPNTPGVNAGRSGLFVVTNVGHDWTAGSSPTLSLTFKQAICWDPDRNNPAQTLQSFHSTGNVRVFFIHLKNEYNDQDFTLETWGNNPSPSPTLTLPTGFRNNVNYGSAQIGAVTTFNTPTGSRPWNNLPTAIYKLSLFASTTVRAAGNNVYIATPENYVSMYLRFGNNAAIPTVISGSPTSTNNSVNIEWDRIENADGYYVGTVDAHNVESAPIEVAQTTSGNPTYTFSSLAPSSTYSFYVKAWNYNNGVSFTEPAKTTSLPRIVSATTATRAAPPSAGGDGTTSSGGTTPELVPGVNRTLDTPTWNYITDTAPRGTIVGDWSRIENAAKYALRMRDDKPADNFSRTTFREEFVRTQATYFASSWGWAVQGVYPGNALNGLLTPTNDEYPKLTLTADENQPYLKGIWINGTLNIATMVIAGNHSALLGGNRAPVFELLYNIITNARSETVRLILDPAEAATLVNAPVGSDDHLGASRFGGVQTTMTWNLFNVGGFEIATPDSTIAPSWSLRSYRASYYERNASRIIFQAPRGVYHARVKALASVPAYDSGWSEEVTIHNDIEVFENPFLTPAAFVVTPDPSEDLGVRAFAKGIGLTPEGSSTDVDAWALAASIMIPLVVGGTIFVMSGDSESGQRPVFLPLIIANTLWIPASMQIAQINIFWTFFPSLIVILMAGAVLYKRYI